MTVAVAGLLLNKGDGEVHYIGVGSWSMGGKYSHSGVAGSLHGQWWLGSCRTYQWVMIMQAGLARNKRTTVVEKLLDVVSKPVCKMVHAGRKIGCTRLGSRSYKGPER